MWYLMLVGDRMVEIGIDTGDGTMCLTMTGIDDDDDVDV